VEAGAGGPAVVLEAGAGNGAASWQRVIPLLAPHVRVAAYDRAGLGGSDPAPGLATIDRMIDDLASVIAGLGAVELGLASLPAVAPALNGKTRMVSQPGHHQHHARSQLRVPTSNRVALTPCQRRQLAIARPDHLALSAGSTRRDRPPAQTPSGGR
jgi:hypothetical protein